MAKINRPFLEAQWDDLPEIVRQYIHDLEKIIEKQRKEINQQKKKLGDHQGKIDNLTAKDRQNSTNSSKPPSSDLPFNKPKRDKQSKSGRKRGGQKGHKGHRQQLLPTDHTIPVMPQCTCGHHQPQWDELEAFHTHQHIELPKIEMDVRHYILMKAKCRHCGSIIKATLPDEVATGYGPRFSAFITELSGIKAMSRSDVQQLVQSVLDVPIATGTIQKIVDRGSEALKPVYERIGQVARNQHQCKCNYVDETSWFSQHCLHWLWVMTNALVAFFRIDRHRTKQAFLELIADWRGILVTDGYGAYQKWVHGRQTCLAHLMRKAKALIESRKLNERRFGSLATGFVKSLIDFSKNKPPPDQWEQFYLNLLFALSLYESDEDGAGQLARQMLREIESLWTFIDHDGVEPTNNRSERALRFGVLWRKRSLGTQSEKGNRWVERILSFKETCRLRGKPTFPLLVDLLEAYFQNRQPDLTWI